MYSPKVVESRFKHIFDTEGVRLVHYDDGQVEDMSAHLHGLVSVFDDDGRPKGGLSGLKRPLTESEEAYIVNERRVCQVDFRYFARRYCHIKHAAIAGEPTRISRMGSFMLTQEMLLQKMADAEDEMMDGWERGEPVSGLWFLNHKARQTGFTAICRMMSNHRTIFYSDTTALAASINEDMVHELYARDKIIYDAMPWWLKPAHEYDTKGQQFTFKHTNSGTIYHQSNQKGGMGTGRTISSVHLTECALWESAGGAPGKIEFDLLPGLPRAVNTLVQLESTANGMGGYWYDAVKAAESGRDNIFQLLFCPWYAADTKYRRIVPVGWSPLPITVDMIETVERTSPIYLGRTIRLDPQQSYYWEQAFLFHKTRKMLAQFYMNYPTTIKESFQHSGQAAFSVETLAELMRGVGTIVHPYDLESLR